MEMKVSALPDQYEYKVVWYSNTMGAIAERLVFATSVTEATNFAELLFGELFYGWELVSVRRKILEK